MMTVAQFMVYFGLFYLGLAVMSVINTDGRSTWPEEPDDANVVPFTEEAVKNYLDSCIRFWRRKGKAGDMSDMAVYYIDAYQSVRVSLFGELLENE